jgi:hypothetical protein
MPTLSTPIQNGLGIPGLISQEEEIKGKVEVKLSLFSDDMILYPKDLKNSTKKLQDIINSFSTEIRYKINVQKSVAFLYTNNEQNDKEYWKTILFTIAS